MRKFTFILTVLVSVAALNAQNLLTNPSFETWTANKPDGWTLGTSGTGTQSATTSTGTGSALQIAASGTYSVTQNVPAPDGGFDISKKYQITVKYKATAGDGTDARVWCNWITSPVGATLTTYWSMSLADSLGLKGPGGNTQPASGIAGTGTNGYLIDSRSSTGFLTYTYSFTPPANATQFSFQIRTYNGATVLWDELYFGLDLASNVDKVKDNETFYLYEKQLVNLSEGAVVEVFNPLGKQVVKSVISNNTLDLSKLAKGIYIVRVDGISKKITL